MQIKNALYANKKLINELFSDNFAEATQAKADPDDDIVSNQFLFLEFLDYPLGEPSTTKGN